MNKSKCLEYYLDSKVYDYESIQKSIDKTKKEYENKEVEVKIELNKYGMYIITFYFKNKDTLFNRIRLLFRKKNKLMLYEKNKKKKKNMDNINKLKYISHIKINEKELYI